MDPYANLSDKMQQRKKLYLKQLVATDRRQGVAQKRGEFKAFWPPPPELDPLDKSLHELLLDELWEWEDLNLVIARLTTTDKSKPFDPPFPNKSPSLDEYGNIPGLDEQVHARRMLLFVRQIGLKVNYEKSVIDWIGETLKAAGIFSDNLTKVIKLSLLKSTRSWDSPATIMFDPQLVERLTEATIEDDEDLDGEAMGYERASRLLEDIARLLPDQVSDIAAVLDPLLPGVYPGAFAGLPLQRIPTKVWNALDLLGWLGRVQRLRLGNALEQLAGRLPKDDHQEAKYSQFPEIARNAYLLPQFFNHPTVELPPGFLGPPNNAEGVYWWRSVLLRHCIEHMLSYKDTSDFHSTDLLRFAHRFKLFDETQGDPRVPVWVKTNPKLTFQHFKYWLDDSPEHDREKEVKKDEKNAEMTFWSENHQILFASSQYLAGQLFPNEEFPRTSRDRQKPVTGNDQIARATPRVQRWLNDRLRFGFSEWNSPVYYQEDLTPLFNLADFCKDPTIKTKAKMVLDLLVFDLARFTCKGSFGVTAGRVYADNKQSGWNQSVGDLIELLFGSRGDFTETEPSAVALATSDYEVPGVLLAIGQDRQSRDRSKPFVDRSRVSITFDDAASLGIGFEKEEDMVFWWGNGAYFEEKTLKGTRKVVEAHPNLKTTIPFSLLYLDPHGDLFAAITGLLLDVLKTPVAGSGAQAGIGFGLQRLGAAGVALPFPLNVVAWSVYAAGTVGLIEGALRIIPEAITVLAKGIETFVEDVLGIGDDDEPEGPAIPESAVIEFLQNLLIQFNRGSVLSRANLYTYNNGDAMLSSVQNHQAGEFAFQKHAWQATLGMNASVWTTAPLINPGFSSYLRTWLEFFKALAAPPRPWRAAAFLALALEPILPVSFEPEGMMEDGPNDWAGSVALPMVVEYRNAAIIAYNLPNVTRAISDAATHAWFPRKAFDEAPDPIDTDNGGTWTFGRKDDGYVALFSARKVRWTNEALDAINGDDDDETKKEKGARNEKIKARNGKELLAEGGSNIWVCLVGNAANFGSFEAFKRETLLARLNISGVGTWNDLQCSFDVPRGNRLELHYEEHKGRYDGKDLQLDEFPRFENRYVTTNPTGAIAWGSRSYEILHAETGLFLRHNFDRGLREHNRQSELLDTKLKHRLVDDSLTTIRLPKRRSAVSSAEGARLRRNLFGNRRRPT